MAGFSRRTHFVVPPLVVIRVATLVSAAPFELSDCAMEKIDDKVEEVRTVASAASTGKLPVSVIIAARNEAKNLPRCLQALNDVGEVYVIDSQSTDETVEIARSNGAQVVQFHYQGGWPKKRQWAMNTLDRKSTRLNSSHVEISY